MDEEESLASGIGVRVAREMRVLAACLLVRRREGINVSRFTEIRCVVKVSREVGKPSSINDMIGGTVLSLERH